MIKFLKEASDFVWSAFQLLDFYEKDPNSSYVGTNSGIRLDGPYLLRINNNGILNLCKIRTNEDGNTRLTTIAHGYHEKSSQITYVGKLLSVYLEYLQRDEKAKRNE